MLSPSPPPSARCVDAMEGALALELGRRVRLDRRPPPTYQQRMSGRFSSCLCLLKTHRIRTHLSLDKDCPQPRRIQPPSAGEIIAFPEVGGLHHRYERRAA
jgi:hypothetical protein